MTKEEIKKIDTISLTGYILFYEHKKYSKLTQEEYLNMRNELRERKINKILES